DPNRVSLLVLSRAIGESITIGDGITIRVASLQGRRARLVITAPRRVRIVRTEKLPPALPVGDVASPTAPGQEPE
ncbi:MAG: carbon storage regulator, partial [Planctomycetaceae bacterium]